MDRPSTPHGRYAEPERGRIPEARPVDEPPRLAVRLRGGEAASGWNVGRSDGDVLRLSAPIILPLALGAGGVLALLIGLAVLIFFVSRLIAGERVKWKALGGIIFLFTFGAVALGRMLFYSRLGEGMTFDGSERKVIFSRRFGLQREAWDARDLGAVRLTIDEPLGDSKETCRLELMGRDGSVFHEIGSRETQEKDAGLLAVAAFQIASILKLPCRVDGTPVTAGKKFRKALEAIAFMGKGKPGTSAPAVSAPAPAPASRSSSIRKSVATSGPRSRRRKAGRRAAEQRRILLIAGGIGGGVLLVVLGIFVVWGIFADKSPSRSRPTTPEGAVKEYHASLKEGVQLMQRVTDEASAREVKPRLEANVQRIQSGHALIDAMPFSERENLRLGRKYLDELTELQDRYQKERLRIAGIPGASTVLGPIINDPLLLTPP